MRAPALRYDGSMVDEQGERPEWALRLRREREARRWSQADAVRAMRTYADGPLPVGLVDQWKRWERGRSRPDEFYRPLIAATLGTVVESIFPTPRQPRQQGTADDLLLARSGMDTHELVQRIRRSSVDSSTLDALSLTVEQLCCEYVSRDPLDLIRESRDWLTRVTALLDERVSLNQHLDILDAAGWLTLLVGCLEYDTGQAKEAEATRIGALQLANEARNTPVAGWAHEMRAWFALTAGRYGDVIDSAQAGLDTAPGRSVSVQLYAQEAKAWARIGDERNVARALENGRRLLDSLPFPERPDNHFVVDPDKFDFYAMDCYRLVGNDTLAEINAREIIRKTTSLDGHDLSPMRKAEAEITLGVTAARRGDLDSAVEYGALALNKGRVSGPSLLMVGSELDNVLQARYPKSQQSDDFHDALRHATASNQAAS